MAVVSFDCMQLSRQIKLSTELQITFLADNQALFWFSLDNLLFQEPGDFFGIFGDDLQLKWLIHFKFLID